MAVGRMEKQIRRRSDAAETKLENSALKAAERHRRDLFMMAKLKTGKFPYTPAVMSWASRKLDKKTSRITQEDIKKLLT